MSPARASARGRLPHVLVTGAAGFVGGACVREFRARGWRVSGLVHERVPEALGEPRSSGRPVVVQRPPGVGVADGPGEGAIPTDHAETAPLHLVRASVADGAQLPARLADHVATHGSVDAVVNCAGRVSDIGLMPRFTAVNVGGVRNLITCMRDLDIDHLVQVSTTDVYGMRDFHAADEGTPLDRKARNPYPASKILAEDAMREALPPGRWTLLRPGVVWGPGDTTILPRIVGFLRGSPCVVHFGRHRGRNRWPLAYVDNVARAAFAAVASPAARGRCYNLIDAERTSVDDYYRMLLQVFAPHKRDMRRVTLPLAAGRVLGGVSTLASNLLRRQQPLWHPSHYEVQSVAYELDFCGARGAALLLSCGLQAVTRDAGVRALQEWVQASPRVFDTRGRSAILPAGG